MASDETTGPVMAVNQKRVALLEAAEAAEEVRWELARSGGSAFGSASGLVDQAWVSPSPARSRFGEQLAGVGSAVPEVFAQQAGQYRAEASHEPVEVDRNDPVQGWKASRSQVQGRVAVASQNPYWGR